MQNIRLVTEAAILTESALRPLLNTLVTGKASHLSNTEKKDVKKAIKNFSIPDFLCCDPDLVRHNFKSICFETLLLKDVTYVYTFDDLDPAESAIIVDFLGDKNVSEIESSWSAFNRLENGIAFRGGAGYTYSIYKHEVKA
jgi:hypothetical protein